MRQSATAVTDFFARKGRAALRLATMAMAVGALAACASSPLGGRGSGGSGGGGGTGGGGTGATSVRVDPNAPVVIAFLAPTTASSRVVSQTAQDLTAAAQLALSERGPANMTMKLYDTKGTAAGAAEAAAHAVREGAALILGPLTGEATAAAAPVAARAGLNVISFSNDPSVAGGNVWVLGQLPGDELQRIFGYAGSQGVSSIALLYPSDRYGQAVANAANGAARDAGVGVGPRIAYERSFQGIEGASKANAGDIRGSGANGVLIADYGDGLRSMSSFLSYYDVSPLTYRYLGLSRWDDPRNASESTLAGGWFAAADPTRRGMFENRFSSQLGRTPSPIAPVGYDAVVAASDILKSAAAGGPAAFSADAITAGVHDGATGTFRLTVEGGNRRALAVMEMTPGGPALLDPAPSGAPGA